MGMYKDKCKSEGSNTQVQYVSYTHTLTTHMHLPRLERVLERSMMACLLGLFKTDRLAREMSAVTRVIDILGTRVRKRACAQAI